MDTLAIKELLKRSGAPLMRLLPRSAERALRHHYYRVRAVEPEILRLPEWCPPDRLAIDIGANRGDYALALSRIARQVVCFEANPGLADDLRRLLRGTNSRIESVGLSDEDGRMVLKVPFVGVKELHGWASIDGDFKGRTWKGREIQGTRDLAVPVTRLDHYELEPVGFVKIDVEGHEWKVLRGAAHLLQRDRPNLLVEIEQLHHDEPIEAIFAWLRDRHGYDGWFLDGSELRSVSEFRADRHQLDPDSPDYRNNFYFTPTDAGLEGEGPAVVAEAADGCP